MGKRLKVENLLIYTERCICARICTARGTKYGPQMFTITVVFVENIIATIFFSSSVIPLVFTRDRKDCILYLPFSNMGSSKIVKGVTYSNNIILLFYVITINEKKSVSIARADSAVLLNGQMLLSFWKRLVLLSQTMANANSIQKYSNRIFPYCHSVYSEASKGSSALIFN